MAGGLAEKRPGHFQEPSREIPLVGDYDVAVVGAGPAGIAAAIAAARRGCRTLLLEKAASVGGVWTSGLVTCVMDGGKAALARELTARLDAMGARMPRQAKMLASNYLFEPEYMKLQSPSRGGRPIGPARSSMHPVMASSAHSPDAVSMRRG